MHKYTERKKLASVKDYCSGQSGLRAVAQRHGIDVSSLRKWVAAFRVHGAAGVKTKKRTRYSLEFKLSVLQRIREEDLSYRQAAALFDIRNFNIIGNWQRAFETGGLHASSPRSPVRKKTMTKKTIPEAPCQSKTDKARTRQQLLDELNHLRMENAYLKKLDALAQANEQSAQPTKRKSCLS